MAGNASGVRRLYLSLYNWIVFIGWVQVSWFMASFATVYPVLFRYLIALRKKALAKAKPHNY
ncbi:unknown protein [Oryza sativa Japonica Group]|uniref:Os01g0150900 protein n=1 Tax=Oryza sativa subsp. japonica TaxID=39947 RepID=Q5ZEI1_ORYSJ|nr:unknown protein [Oryza sativa Japonica Group]BAF03950.1 Os01g0150900 [Oryza sativa Japonica Group]|eukprot:NP_001042036.1 Os01g0150900 [Oryza sativa Japonica Group]